MGSNSSNKKNIQANGLLRLYSILDDLMVRSNADEDEILIVKTLYDFYVLNGIPDPEDLGLYVLDLIEKRKSKFTLVVSNRNED